MYERERARESMFGDAKRLEERERKSKKAFCLNEHTKRAYYQRQEWKKPLYVALSFRCVFVCVYVCIHRAATANYEENRQTREKEKSLKKTQEL